jgi:serine/threonine protein kinase
MARFAGKTISLDEDLPKDRVEKEIALLRAASTECTQVVKYVAHTWETPDKAVLYTELCQCSVEHMLSREQKQALWPYKHGDMLYFSLDEAPQFTGIDEVLQCLLDTTKAVDFLHDRGILHRDIKPLNILRSPDEPPIYKLCDFGLAKVLEGAKHSTDRGTDWYMAPEVQTSPAHYYFSADMFSLGVTFLDILARYSKDKKYRQRYKKAQKDWQSVLKIANSSDGLTHYIPEEAHAYVPLVMALVKEDPQHRCTAKQVLHALETRDMSCLVAPMATMALQESAESSSSAKVARLLQGSLGLGSVIELDNGTQTTLTRVQLDQNGRIILTTSDGQTIKYAASESPVPARSSTS